MDNPKYLVEARCLPIVASYTVAHEDKGMPICDRNGSCGDGLFLAPAQIDSPTTPESSPPQRMSAATTRPHAEAIAAGFGCRFAEFFREFIVKLPGVQRALFVDKPGCRSQDHVPRIPERPNDQLSLSAEMAARPGATRSPMPAARPRTSTPSSSAAPSGAALSAVHRGSRQALGIEGFRLRHECRLRVRCLAMR